MYHGHGCHPWDSATLRLPQYKKFEEGPCEETGILQEEPLSYFKVFDPREMPQEHSHLATYGNGDVKTIVENLSNNYLTEEEETSIISRWPALLARLVRQKAILASRPDDVRDCLILLNLMLTSTPSTAKCEPGFSAMNHLKCNLRTALGQNTLQTWCKCVGDWAVASWLTELLCNNVFVKSLKKCSAMWCCEPGGVGIFVVFFASSW